MKLVFKKIPKIAICFYLVGFTFVFFGFFHFIGKWQIISEIENLQMFIGGAIVIAIGSVINLLFQLKKR
jgi:hypothetical protein